MGQIILIVAVLLSSCVFESSQLKCHVPEVAHSDTETCQATYVYSFNISTPGPDGTKVVTTMNVTYSLHDMGFNVTGNEDYEHCLIYHFPQDATLVDEMHCDYDFVCDNSLLLAKPDTPNLILHKGEYSLLYCCDTDYCNDDEVATRLANTPQLPCVADESQMIVTKRLLAKPHFVDVLVYSCDEQNFCANQQIETNKCKTINDAQTKESIEVCCCDSLDCTSGATTPPLPVTPLHPMNPVAVSHSWNWKFFGGLIAAAALIVMILVIAVIVIRKYREHKRRPLRYSYKDLTSDLAEDRSTDEDLIVG